MDFNKIAEITQYLSEHEKERRIILTTLLSSDKITIAELVDTKEKALRGRLEQNKEDLSNASAIIVRFLEKINPKTLKDDAWSLVNKLGFFKQK